MIATSTGRISTARHGSFPRRSLARTRSASLSATLYGKNLYVAWKASQGAAINWSHLAWDDQGSVPATDASTGVLGLQAWKGRLWLAWKGGGDGDTQGIYVAAATDRLVYDYAGWKIDLTNARTPATPDQTLIDAVDRQLDLVTQAGLRVPVLEFMRTVSIWADPANRAPGNGHYAPATGVDLRVRGLAPDKPIGLHELLHAYHDQIVRHNNPDIIRFYAEAFAARGSADPPWSDNEYMFTNEEEFFATTASTYLYAVEGRTIDRAPYSNAQLCAVVQDYCTWLGKTLTPGREGEP